VEFRDGRFAKDESFSGHSAGGTVASYLHGPKIAGVLPLEGQIRANSKYVLYDRTSDTSSRFRLAENSAIYDVRAGVRTRRRAFGGARQRQDDERLLNLDSA
jgi:hypothetical protein